MEKRKWNQGFPGKKMNSNFKLFWEKLLNFWATRRRIIGGGEKISAEIIRSIAPDSG
jgi:hypothetical protein